jgi:serine phosphatase RsbU (regulator of sigma subunit)
MAELRYAIRAYATDGDAPAAILTKISRLIDVGREGQFATVLCGSIDVSGHRITLANAGHPDLLVVGDNDAWYAKTVAGTPVGVYGATAYTEVTVTVPDNATVLAFTDGLVERRGEDLGTGLERLRSSALAGRGSLEDLLTTVLAQSTSTGPADDTAILGIRWNT